MSRPPLGTGPPNIPVVPLRELSPEVALSRLELSVGRRIDGLLSGDHPGFGLGPGSELAEARLYQRGQDDVRRIDWNVTARTGEVHVRDLVADRELTTWALVDATASMDFGTALMEKRDLAAAVTIALAYVTNRGADQFGVHLLTTDGVLSWPHRSGRTHRLMMLRGLAEAPRKGYGDPPGLATGVDVARPAPSARAAVRRVRPARPASGTRGRTPCAAWPWRTGSSSSRSSTHASSTCPTSAW